MKRTPEGAVQVTEEDLSKKGDVFELGKNIYIREIPWEQLKEVE